MYEKLAAYKIPLLLGAGSIFFIATSLFLLIKTYQSTTPIQFSNVNASESGQLSNQIVVDVQGAVKFPGVYHLAVGSRVEDALVAAGGLAANADSERIAKTVNRAMILSDGMKLYIPSKGETQGGSTSMSQGSLGGVGVSVNLASQAQLEALPGIGPVTAGKIIDNRPYMSLEELVSKGAVSRSLFEKLKDQLTL